MRRGLATMVPVRALSLFTWQEVETLVAGKPDVDIALLKRHTRYEQYTASHPVIRRFWRVFASLTQEDRSRYVRFVWGRSRLPSDGGTWTSSHTIQKQSGGDRTLPMAHTCFFTIGACPLCGPVIALRLAAPQVFCCCRPPRVHDRRAHALGPPHGHCLWPGWHS